MPVSQRLIDLLNTPAPKLREMAKERDIAIAPRATQWQLAQALATLSRDELESATDGYLYAGQTSLSWVRLVPEDEGIDVDRPEDFYPMVGESFNPDDAEQALRATSDADPFDETARPEDIEPRPKLVHAKSRPGAEGEYVLTLAYARSLRRVIHNFERRNVYEDEFFQVVLRPDRGLFEVRASASIAQRTMSTWIADFAAELDLKPVPVAITYPDFLSLRDELGAILDVYRGRDATGTSVFGTVALTRQEAVADDLLDEEEFEDATEDLEPVSLELLFDYPGYGGVRVYVSINNGSVFIRNSVPDEVIEHIYRAVLRVKGTP